MYENSFYEDISYRRLKGRSVVLFKSRGIILRRYRFRDTSSPVKETYTFRYVNLLNRMSQREFLDYVTLNYFEKDIAESFISYILMCEESYSTVLQKLSFFLLSTRKRLKDVSSLKVKSFKYDSNTKTIKVHTDNSYLPYVEISVNGFIVKTNSIVTCFVSLNEDSRIVFKYLVYLLDRGNIIKRG